MFPIVAWVIFFDAGMEYKFQRCMKHSETKRLYDTKIIQSLGLLVNLNTGIHTD